MKKLLFSFANSPLKIITVFVLNMIVVSLLFAVFEDVTVPSAFWWSVVTISTVGYGDVSPITTSGQTLGALFIMFNFLILGPLIIANILIHLIEDKNQFSDHEQERLFTRVKNIEEMVERIEKKVEK